MPPLLHGDGMGTGPMARLSAFNSFPLSIQLIAQLAAVMIPLLSFRFLQRQQLKDTLLYWLLKVFFSNETYVKIVKLLANLWSKSVILSQFFCFILKKNVTFVHARNKRTSRISARLELAPTLEHS